LESCHLPRLPVYANEILSINEYIEERDQQTQKKKAILAVKPLQEATCHSYLENSIVFGFNYKQLQTPVMLCF